MRIKNLTRKQRDKWWRITVALAVLIVVVTYSPLVLAHGKTDPRLFGLPYNLWTSMLTTLALVALTWVGGKLHATGEERHRN